MLIDDAGRLVIGHTTALDDLRGTDPYLQVLGSGLDSAHIGVVRYSNSVNGGHVTIGKSRSGTVGTNTIVQDGDKLGSLNFVGGDGVDYHEGAVIEGIIDGTPGVGDMPTALSFQTAADGSSNATERMRITSDGKVGIGKTDPNYPLVVAGTNPKIQIYDSDGNGQTNLYFGDSGSNLAGYVIYQHSDDKMRIGTSATDRITIDSNGRIIAAGGFCAEDGITVIGQSERTHFQAVDSEASTAPRWRPSVDNVADLGDSSLRWDDVRATNGTIQTSDRNEKNTITDSDLGLDFVKRLSPKSYKFNGKTRTHYGLIAQDVETVLSDISKPTTDFAGFIKDDISEEQDGSELRYGLRYTEFVSPLVKAIQEQQTIIEDLKARIETLEGGE